MFSGTADSGRGAEVNPVPPPGHGRRRSSILSGRSRAPVTFCRSRSTTHFPYVRPCCTLQIDHVERFIQGGPWSPEGRQEQPDAENRAK